MSGLTEKELLFIHDRAKATIPFMQVLIDTQGDNKYAPKQVKMLTDLKNKCQKVLINKFKYSAEYLNAER